MTKFIFLLFLAPLYSFAQEAILIDQWYTLHINPGNKPLGFYHEVVVQKNGQYFYRYDMTRRMNGMNYSENIGAIAKEDLTPVAFNLNKVVQDNIISLNGVYEVSANGGAMKFVNSSKKKETINLKKNTILESFFPIWIKKKWPELKPGTKFSLLVFSENQNTQKFQTYNTTITVKGDRKGKSCREINVEHIQMKSIWCIDSNGVLDDLVVGNNEILVTKSKNEIEAKSIFSQQKH